MSLSKIVGMVTALLAVVSLLMGFSFLSNDEMEDTYDEMLSSVISHIEAGDFEKAAEKLKRLKESLKDKTNIEELFQKINFPLKIEEVLDILEHEINICKDTSISSTPSSFVLSWSIDFFRSNQDIFSNLIQFYESFNFVPDVLIKEVVTAKRKVIVNFSQVPIYSSPNNIILNIRRNEIFKDQLYFLPELSYMAEALFTFIKNELKCSAVSILYPKDKKESAAKIKEVGWSFGISAPLIVDYEGIDLIPFFREKGEKMFKSKANEQEIFSKLSEHFENIRCVVILDNPRNSATIIPQFRFIGAKNLYFIGFYWHKIKDIIEKRYYGKIFYADIVDEETTDRMRTYISELKNITEFFLKTPNMSAEKIEFTGDSGKIVITFKKHTTRSVFIFRIEAEGVEKVLEYFRDEPVIKD